MCLLALLPQQLHSPRDHRGAKISSGDLCAITALMLLLAIATEISGSLTVITLRILLV